MLHWKHNGFCLWLKRLESERFKSSPNVTDEAIVLNIQKLNWLLDGFDLWRNRPRQVLPPPFRYLPRIIRAMISLPDDLPDDPVLLKQLLTQLMIGCTVDKGDIVVFKRQSKLLRDRLFSRKSKPAVDTNTPQLAIFNEQESESLLAVIDDADEEVFVLVKRRDKRKPLSADLPCIEVIYDLPEHELTCACGCPQTCHWRRNQRAVGHRVDADPRDQTCAQGLRLPRL